MNVICKLTAWTNKTAALGIVAVALAAFGTVVGPAPKVADIGTAWNGNLDKASSLSKDNELGKSDELDKSNEFSKRNELDKKDALDKKDSLDKRNELSKVDQLAAKIDDDKLDKNTSLGVDQL